VNVRTPESELEEFARRSTDRFARHFIRMAHGIVGDNKEYESAYDNLARVIGETMTMADLYGRRRLFLELDAAMDRAPPDAVFDARTDNPIIPHVAFTDAFNDLIRREPRLAATAQDVADLYKDRYSFALVKSADEALTERIRNYVAASVQGTPSITEMIREIGDFTKSYADTVYRTNLTTAYTAGRFEQAQDPDVRAVIPAMERFSVRDSALRSGRPQDNGENHAAAHGFVADTRDPMWARVAPPSGYNCRCSVRMVSNWELRKRGLLEGVRVLRYTPPSFENFAPHPRFGLRNPKTLIYG